MFLVLSVTFVSSEPQVSKLGGDAVWQKEKLRIELKTGKVSGRTMGPTIWQIHWTLAPLPTTWYFGSSIRTRSAEGRD